MTLNGAAAITGDLFVPGTPEVRLNGRPAYAGTLDGTGVAAPSNYQITLNGGARLRHIVRRSDAIALPAVLAPPSPTGTRSVVIASAGQSPGEFSTVRSLTLNGQVGQFAIPPGTYGDVTVNGGSGLTLGVAGATQPSIYNLQRLAFNGHSQVQVIGPVILNVARGFTGNGILGTTANPGWLTINLYSGGLTLNGGATLHGFVNVPNGTVVVNGNSQLIGGVACDRLIVNGAGFLRLTGAGVANRPPVVSGAMATIAEDTSATITLSATDADGDPLVFSVLAPPSRGSLSAVTPGPNNTASVTYTPNLNHYGTDAFTVGASDGIAVSSPATIRLEITPVNDQPIAESKLIAVDEDTETSITLNGTDADGDTLLYTVITPPTRGVLSGTGAHRVYKPFLNYHGSDSFSYVSSDGSLTSQPANVVISVSPVNDAPLALASSYSVNEGATVAFRLTGDDVDGDELTFEVLTTPGHGVLSGMVPNLTYRPNANYHGIDGFLFRVSDGTLQSATASVTIHITDLNFAPVAQNTTAATDEDIAVTITVSATDADGDALEFLVVTPPLHGVLGPMRSGPPGAGGLFVYTPNPNYHGPDGFTYKVRDANGADSNVASVMVTVRPINDPPVANSQTLQIDEDGSLTVVLTGSDLEGSALAFAISSHPAHGSVGALIPGQANSAAVTYRPNPDYHGEDAFSFTTYDGDLESLPATIFLNVRPVNDAPTAHGQSVALIEDHPRTFTLTGSDDEGSKLGFVVLTPPVHGTLGPVEPSSANSAIVTYSPRPNFHGSDSFTFEVSDGERVSAPALVTLEVAPVDDPPIALAQSLVQPQDTAFNFTLAATDADDDELTYQIQTYPARGVVNGTAPNFTYTPQPGDRGTVALAFTATDGRLTSEPATVTFTMMAVNQAPVAMAIPTVTLDEDNPTAVTLRASDSDGDALMFQVLDHPTRGSLGAIVPGAENTVALLYTPTPNESGTDSFSFWVSDGARDSNIVTVSLVIRPVNDAPVASAQTFTLAEDASVEIALAATDADGDMLTYAVLTPPANGALSGVAPRLTYTPAPNFFGSNQFTWIARDSSLSESAPATVSLMILPVNDAPVATKAEVATDEDVPVAITLSGSDVDSTDLTYRVIASPRHGTLSGPVPHLTYTPARDFAGSDSFTFKVIDGALAESNVATVALVVRPVDDLPVVHAGTDHAVVLPAFGSLNGAVTDPDGPPPLLTWSLLSGPGAVEFENAHAAVTRVAFPVTGIYTLRLTATSGAESVSDDVQITVSASTLAFRTYTTSADFDLGLSSNVTTAVPDQLQLKDEAAPGNFIWVAVSSKGTVAKINTRTGNVEGEYWTAPEGQPRDPSRTTVDLQGAVWVANRAGNSIVQIGSVESGLWIDKNGNGQPDTSVGLGDIREWSNAGGSDTAGGISTADDECIIHYVRVSASGTRHLSVDPKNNIWVSGVSGPDARTFELVNGRTGAIIRREGPVGHGAYGGLIDRANVLWSTTAGSLLRWETPLPLSGPNGENWSTLAGGGNLYGLALGPDGYVWCSTFGAGLVHKYAPSGLLVASYGQGYPQAQGIVVDRRGHVWIAHGLSASTVGHLRPDGTFVGNVVVGAGPTGLAVDADGKIWATNNHAGTVSRIDPDSGPVGADGVTPVGAVDFTTVPLGGTVYNYSDMTGSNLVAPPLTGVWTVVYDSEKPATPWGSINWHAQMVDDSKLSVTVASSPDGVAFSPWRTAVRGVDLDVPPGRYLKVNVLMQRSSSGHSPLLYDLTIGEQGYLPAYPFNQDPQIAAPEVQAAADGIEVRLVAKVTDDGLPHPASLSYSWSKLSGPGTVSFDQPAQIDVTALFSEKGTYVVRLTATDGATTVNRDVTVLANTPPTANAGPDLRVSNGETTLVLRGTAYDDAVNKGTLTVQWRQIAGPALASFANAASPTSNVTFPAVGTYVFELSADDGWAVSRDLMTVRVGPLSSSDAPTDMALYWPFDEGTADVVRGQIARLGREASLSEGRAARGLHLDGIDDFAKVLSHSDHDLGLSSAGMTIEFWFRPQVNRDGMILSWGEAGTPGLAIYQTDAGRELEVNLRDRVAGSDRTLRTVGRLLVPDQWMHVAITHDRTTGSAILYLNGNIHRTTVVGTAGVRTQFPLILGRAAWDATSHWAGVLDELAFFHRPLDFAAVNALFANGGVGRNTVAAGLAPVANAGPEVRIRSTSEVASLAGTMTDDSPGQLRTTWSVVTAPSGGQVQFAASNAAATTATFSLPGTYLLKLDGEDASWRARPDFVTVRVATSAAEPSAGVTAWWPADGSVQEVIAGRANVELLQGASFGPGRVMQAFHFDGADDHGRIKASADTDIGASVGGLTIEFWAKPTALRDGTLLSWGAPGLPGVSIYQHDAGRSLDFNLRDRATVTDAVASTRRVLIPGVWMHFAVTYDIVSTWATVYVNGVVVQRTPVPARALRTQHDLVFGRNAWDSGSAWSGALDEVALYERALAQDEIARIFEAGADGKLLPRDQAPLVADAGADLDLVATGVRVALGGSTAGEGQTDGSPAVLWSVISAPPFGVVEFADATRLTTDAVFSTPGLYILRLSLSDGIALPVWDTKEVRVAVSHAAEPPGGIVAWWPGNGHAREIIQGGKDIQFVNGEGFAPGKVSQGFYFNAVANGRAEVAATPAIDLGASAAGFTVEFWAQPSQLSDGAILSWGAPNTPGLTIYQTDAGRSIEANLRERATGADWTTRTPIALSAGTWVHYALTYDRVSGWATLYLNGQVVRRTSLPARAVRTQHALSFGRNAWDQAFAWKGVLDEVALYSRPLSQGELQGIFLSGAFGKIPPDDNLPPVVDAGPDQNNVIAGNAVPLGGVVLDDHRPYGVPVSTWSVLHAPPSAGVTFSDASSPSSTAIFSTAGLYLVQLTASDGLTRPVADATEVRVGAVNTLAPPLGIAAWWSGNGHPRELINGGHDIQFVNSEGYAAGRVSQGFYFNATNEGRADVPAHSALDIGASETGFSIEFWLKPTAVADGVMLSWGAPGLPGLAIYQYDAGRAIQANLRDRVSGADFGLTTPHLIVAGGWTHYVLTYDRIGAIARAYINGALVASGDLPSRAVRTQYDISLGRNAWDSGSPWRGVLDEITLYKRPLAAAEVLGLFQAGDNGKAPPAMANVAPLVALVEPLPGTAVEIGQAVTLLALAADSDSGISRVEFFDGTVKLGETSVAEIGRPTAFAYTLSGGFTTSGRRVVRARAIDRLGLAAWSEEVALEVVTVLPLVAITAPLNNAVLAAGAALTLEATASYTLGPIVRVEFYQGAIKLGEASVAAGSSYQLGIPGGLAPGAHTLKARGLAQDGRAAFSAAVNVTVTAITAPPVVALTAPVAGANVNANQALTMTAVASDADGSIATVEFYVGANKVGEDASAPYSIPVVEGLPAGVHSLRARAIDNSALSAFSETVTVTAVTSASGVQAWLSAPLDDARITAPITVTGIVGSAALQSWTVEYRLKAADGVPGESWITAATGTASVGTPASGGNPAIPGVLGTFDPTRLINGIYELQLRVTETTGAITTVGPVPVLVEGNMKIGAFSVAFEDLKVPVAGIPLTITRMYDSRDVRAGDFGPGWRLAINNIRVQKNRHLGNAWWQTPQAGSGIQFYDVLPQRDRVVTVVMPDGVTHRFRAGALVKNREGDPDNRAFAVVVKRGKYRFYPIGDTTSQLEPLDADNQLADEFYIGGTNEQDLSVDEFGFEPFNPSRYRLTTADGTRYTLDEKLGLIELRDLEGNTLVLDRDPANRVTGVTARQITAGEPIARRLSIARDAAGRVDYIRDLAGKDLDYVYDGQGRLEAFVDRENHATQFRYENPSFPYYLTRIVDPRGVPALRSEYDASGKLISHTDADGKVTAFDRGLDATGRFEKVTDRLGHATTVYYNERGNVTLKIDPLGAQTRFDYWPDSDRVKFETDHYGNIKARVYDAQGNVVIETTGASAAEDPQHPINGYVSRTTYNARGGPMQMTDAAGRVQTFAYDPVTNFVLSHTVAPDAVDALAGDRTTYTYHLDGSPHTITDALGNVTTHGYEYGLVDPAYPGAVKRSVVTVVDPAGVSGSDRTNPVPAVLRTILTWFDVHENQIATSVSRTLPDGTAEDIVTRNVFDAEHRLRATLLPDGRVTETRYTSFGGQEKTLLWRTWDEFAADPRDESRARVTSYSYDARGNQILVTHPDGGSEATGFDLENRRIWSQDRRGQRTFFVHDAGGRLRYTIHPDANDGLGAAAPSSATDPRLADNPRDETRYDLIGRVRFQIDARNATTEFTYADGAGEPMLRTQSIQHHTAGNPVTRYEYDPTGNIRFVTDPQGNTVETRYDDRGRPVNVLLPATDQHPVTQSQTRYDALGRRVAMVDQEGRIIRYRYDAIGRLVEVRHYLDSALAASDGDLGLLPGTTGVVSTRYSYDAAGNQQTQTDALGRVTTFWTDQRGRRTKRVLPKDSAEAIALAETLTYDAWGNLWKRTDFAGHTATFAFDALNRLISKTADGAHPSLAFSHAIARVEYEYDANGARRAARTFNAANVPLYVESTPRDERGRLTRKDNGLGRLDYTYYSNGLLKDVVSSNAAGVNVGYRYDALNRLEWVDDASTGLPTRITAYSYTANGSLASVAQPNGVVHAYAYDALNRLRTLNVARAANHLHSYDYKLRRSGSRQQIVEGAKTTTYTYDELDRLTTELIAGDAAGQNGTVGYDLDKVGNRLARSSGLARLTDQTGLSYNARDWLSGDLYTANGSTRSSPQVAALNPQIAGIDRYDFEERLILRTRPDGTTINLSYDADGHRIGKNILSASVQPLATTSWLVDTNNLTGYAQVFEEQVSTASGTTRRIYTYGSDLVSQATSVNAGTWEHRYFAYDGHGSTRELTDHVGAVTDRYDYDAYGVLIRRSGVTVNAYLYCGEQFDADLGLYYLRARYLNPDSGRFWSMDDYEGSNRDPASLHKYGYASGNPVSNVDPTGNYSVTDVALTTGVVGTLVNIAGPTIRMVGGGEVAATRLEGFARVFNAVIASYYFPHPFVVGVMADEAAAGLQQLITGKHQPTLIAQSAMAAGASAEMAEWISTGVQVGVSFPSLLVQASRMVAALRNLQVEMIAAPGFRSWNQFQQGTAGQFATRAEAAKAWSVYKDANGVVTGSTRSTGARSEYLRSLTDDPNTASWLKQWLREGRVPPGHQVDHIKPLSIGGADVPANMRLQGTDLHRTHHQFYDPWNW